MQADPHFIDLLVQAAEGVLDESGYRELDRYMTDNPDYIRVYAEFFAIAGMMRQGGSIISKTDSKALHEKIEYDLNRQVLDQDTSVECVKEEPVNRVSKRPTFKSVNKLIWAAAAVILYFVSLEFVLNVSRNDNIVADRVVATITNSVDAKWDSQSHSLDAGHDLHAGRYILTDGYVQLTSTNGSKVIVQSPAELYFETAKDILLVKGAVVTRVSEGTKGFTVRTPHASVVDFSTEFGVLVNDDGETVAHVFDGEVEVRDSMNPTGFDKKVRLGVGESARVDYKNIITKRAIDTAVFHRQLPTEYEADIYRLKPVAFWRFDSDSSYPVNTINSTDRSARYSGKVKFVRGSGVSGSAVDFSGVDSYVSVPEFFSDNFPGEECSLIALVCPESDKQQNILLTSNIKGPEYNFSMQLRINSEKKYEFYTLTKSHVANTTKGKFTLSSDCEVKVGKWVLLAISVGTDNSVRFYVNGELSASMVLNDRLYSSYHDLYIGCASGNKMRYPEHRLSAFEGAIDNIAVLNYALSDNDVRQIYMSLTKNNNKPGKD